MPTENVAPAKQPVADPTGDELGRFLKERGYTSIPFETTQSGYIEVAVSVGKKRLRLVVDTGAFATHLDPQRTKDLKLEWLDLPGTQQPPGFPEWDLTKVCKVEGVAIGGFNLGSVLVHAHDISSVNAALEARKDPLVDGLLGADILRRYSGVIDYGAKRLFLRAPK